MNRDKQSEENAKKKNPFELYLQEIELAQVKIYACVSNLRHKLVTETICYRATLEENDRLRIENFKLRNPEK